MNIRFFTWRPINIFDHTWLRSQNDVFQTKFVEKIQTHILNSVPVFENRAVYEIMFKNFIEPDRVQMAEWRVRFSWWIPKATNTHSELCNNYCFFHCNNCCTNAPQCYVIRALSVLFRVMCVFRQLTEATSACRDVEKRGPQHQLSVRDVRFSRPKVKPPNPVNVPVTDNKRCVGHTTKTLGLWKPQLRDVGMSSRPLAVHGGQNELLV